jgi:hypothetical protein
MTVKNSVEQILYDIDFEIAQGLVSQEALGPGLDALRQFQNRLRSDAFRKMKLTDPQRDILGRQFQLNDSLLAFLQEMALRIQTLQHALATLQQFAPPPFPQALTNNAAEEQEGIQKTFPPSEHLQAPTHATPAQTDHAPLPAQPVEEPTLEFRSADDILHAIRPQTIAVPFQARAIRWPIIGWLLTKLRIYYQRPAMFYTALLSERQAPVNQALGERILYLEALLKAQQKQIDALQSQIEKLTPPSE